MPIEDFLNAFQYDPAHFSLDEFKAKVLEEYNGDLSIRDAKVAEVETGANSYKSEIQRLKALNYDLLMNKPIGEDAPKTPGQPNGSENQEETDVSLGSLFGKKE